MSGGRLLTDAEFGEVIHDFEHTAFRLELQDQYLEPSETELVTSYLRGDPIDPLTSPGFRNWCDRIAEHVRQGKRIERVRVHRNPPTDYQRWERWLDQWNRRAGEVMRYMTPERAREIGLLPAAGDIDWWLLDSSRLIVMRFDSEGHRIENELITDPASVVQACKWRDLAVHHSVRSQDQDVAA